VVDARDRELLQRALRLAERGRGHTSPNPVVGAVIARPDGTIVGEGYHHAAGTPHAEVHALAAAGERSRGAVLYCTLEPCCHTGRTGPCAERIVSAGITRVVAAVRDPNPLVAGGGFRYLRAHGIEVEEDVAPREAARQNAAFFTFMRAGRPFVLFKAAVSLDGRIAAAHGERTPISGLEAQRDVQRLRAEMDAIAVGSGTVLVDDPLLSVRDVYRDRPFARVIFDRRLRTPPTARVFSTRGDGPIILMAGAAALRHSAASTDALRHAGAQIELTEDGSVRAGLARLGELGVTSLLLEGGAALSAAAWDAGMIDRVRLYVAPTPLGSAGVPLLDGTPFSTADLYDRRVEPCGDDVLIEGDVHRID
jgi:diaminohydroxyphosphoribosylaminopyrimidine deaminase / 5-amino-6-(5-phosphoribosylamino)uracil reductase